MEEASSSSASPYGEQIARLRAKRAEIAAKATPPESSPPVMSNIERLRALRAKREALAAAATTPDTRETPKPENLLERLRARRAAIMAEREATASSEKKEEEEKEEPKSEKEEEKRGRPDIDNYMERVVMQYLVAAKMASNKNKRKVLDNIQEKGDYNEIQEEALERFGGHDEVANAAMRYFRKKGYSKKAIIAEMKDMQERGFTMFDDLIGSA